MAVEILTEMGEDELVSRLADEKERLFKLRFQLATGQLENSSAIKKAKKDIARLLTELRAREIAAAEAVAGGAS
ncbi:MAG: 50S ribosomal protein L29 [Microthrixaceae bacterium]|nr:50S ribosomal protein L29 [Microthrixaceae bacterium]MCB1012153.1 50S ribosomal protein L29 [Microthrixaceae bacterium]MCO5320785.1 50S ribosomal protein L29 [Microthrixaceae bacterium]